MGCPRADEAVPRGQLPPARAAGRAPEPGAPRGSVPRLVLDENATYMQAMFAPWGARRPAEIGSALERTPQGGVRNLHTGTNPVELHYNGPGRGAHGSKTLSMDSMIGALPPCADKDIERQIVLLDYVRLARRSANCTVIMKAQ